MHLGDDRIDQLLHDELPEGERREARAHLATCAACTRRESEMAREDREIAGALAVLDHPVERVDVGTIEHRARRGAQMRWRMAIAGAAMFAATAAAAMPGSPVRRWLVTSLSSDDVVAPVATTPPSAVAAEAGDVRGVSIVVGDSADVVFDAWQGAGEIAIRVTEERELRVRARDGSAEFVVRPGGVRVRNDGSRARYEIDVPRAAASVRVIVAGRTVFARRGVTSPGAADTVTVRFTSAR